jgi:hypothetical protein
MATGTHSTTDVRPLLAPFFPGWLGDAGEPALPKPPPTRPRPHDRALRAELERRIEDEIGWLDFCDDDSDLEDEAMEVDADFEPSVA